MGGNYLNVEMEYVYVVYKEKSFSKAAQKLFVSQSAVSAMVRKAEKKIGCQIFDRSTIPLTVTKEGEYYISCAEQFMGIEKNMDAYFNDMASLKTGRLSVGSSSFFCAYFLANLIKRFKKKYPGVTVEIHEGNIRELREGLMNDTIDLLMETAIQDDEDVEKYLFSYEHIILGIPAEYQVTRKLRDRRMNFQEAKNEIFLKTDFPAIPMQMLREEPFIFLKKENDICQRSIQICKNAGFSPKVEMYLDQIMTSFYVAKSGAGIAFLRSSLLNLVSETEELFYYKIGDPLARRAIFLTHKKGRYRTRAMEAFMKLAEVDLEEA